MIEKNIPGSNTLPGSCPLWSSVVRNSLRKKDLLNFLKDEGEAEETVDQLLAANFLRRVAGESDLYVVTGLENREQSKALNTFKLSSALLPSPDLMSQHIRNLLLQLFNVALNHLLLLFILLGEGLLVRLLLLLQLLQFRWGE